MKAAYISAYGEPDVLKYGDWDEPAPEADQLLISVKMIPINFADIQLRSGPYGRAQEHRH